MFRVYVAFPVDGSRQATAENIFDVVSTDRYSITVKDGVTHVLITKEGNLVAEFVGRDVNVCVIKLRQQ